MKCAHCLSEYADNTWDFHACVDGGKRRTGVLCDACDREANHWLLDFFRVKSAAKKIAAYRGVEPSRKVYTASDMQAAWESGYNTHAMGGRLGGFDCPIRYESVYDAICEATQQHRN